MITIETHYTLSANVVHEVSWETEDGTCEAILNPDGITYTYTSTLGDDADAVVSERPMSLADCALAAYVHLGLIPAQNFEPIECSNKH